MIDLEHAIALLIANGNELRRAGVRDLRVGELYVTLAAPDAPVEINEPDEDIGDPLLDPLTYGRRKQVPGFDRDEGTR